MIEASVFGVFRTLLVIIGVITVLRFIGKIMKAKREQETLSQFNRDKAATFKAKQEAEKNAGKITINKIDSSFEGHSVTDIDFEDLDSKK